eukprot:Nk52_evm92s485 gene=Nk52_evmTU92s485
MSEGLKFCIGSEAVAIPHLAEKHVEGELITACKFGEKKAVFQVDAKDKKRRVYTSGIILSHGAGGDMNSDVVKSFAENICQRTGIPVLRYTWKPLNLKSRVKALAAVVKYVTESSDAGAKCAFQSVFLVGRSMGCRVSLYLALQLWGQKKGGETYKLPKVLPALKGIMFCSYPLHQPGKPPNSDSPASLKMLSDDRVSLILEFEKLNSPIPTIFFVGSKDDLSNIGILKSVLELSVQGTRQQHQLYCLKVSYGGEE